jgi:type IV fimbrial biogenesis protein FimT
MPHAPQHRPSKSSAIRTIAASQCGFTMIELMIVLAVTGVLMAIAMPDFARATRSIQLSHQAKEMAGAIKLARAEAIRRGQTVVMCRSNATQTNCNTGSPTSDWSNGWLIYVDVNNNATYDPTMVPSTLVAVKSSTNGNIEIIAASLSPIANRISFNAAGEAFGNNSLNSNGTLTFSHKGASNQTQSILLIDNAGRVRVLTYDQWLNL